MPTDPGGMRPRDGEDDDADDRDDAMSMPETPETPETPTGWLARLDIWAMAAARLGAKPTWAEEWQLLRVCPDVPSDVPPGRVLVVLGGIGTSCYLLVSRALVRERYTHPEVLRLGTDALRAASIVLYRRQQARQDSTRHAPTAPTASGPLTPASFLHLAYTLRDGRLQVVSSSPRPIIPAATAPARPARDSGDSGDSRARMRAPVTPRVAARVAPMTRHPATVSAVTVVRLPGWLDWMRPAVATLLGVSPEHPERTAHQRPRAS